RHVRSETLRERAVALLGRELAQASVPIETAAGGMRLRGLAGTPQAAQARADCQYLFVNGRYVRDRVLAHAVREAYSELLPGERRNAAAGRRAGSPARLCARPAPRHLHPGAERSGTRAH